MKLSSSIRRHTLVAFTIICGLVATGCVTIEEDDGGERDRDSNNSQNNSGGSATCSSACVAADQCESLATVGLTMDDCVAACQQSSAPQSFLDCVVTASCDTMTACDGSSGNSSGPSQANDCSGVTDCPWHSCSCGTDARICANGTCLDADFACSNACE